MGTFNKRVFLQRQFYTKEMLERLTINRYGQLNDIRISTLKVYFLHLFIIKILCQEILEKIPEIYVNSKDVKFAVLCIISLTVQIYL